MDSKVRVFSYSGRVPASVFIERLHEGLTKVGCEIVSIGEVDNHASIHVDNYTKTIVLKGKLSKFFIFSLLNLVLLSQPRTFIWIYQRVRKNSFSVSKNVNDFIKYASVLYFSPDIFHLHWASNIDFWLPLQERGIKIVCSLRGRLINTLPLSDEQLRDVYQSCFPSVDGFHAVSQAIKIEAMKYGADKNKTQVVYSGLPLKDLTYQPTSEYYPMDPIKIVSVGRSNWKKGYHYALETMRILKERGISFRYKIIGIGESEEIAYLMNYYGFKDDEVSVTGSMPFKDIKELVRAANILILPSVEEGIANVVLEAMALGTPVCSTDCGGMNEVITNGINGWIVPSRSPEAMAEAIVVRMNLPHSNILNMTQAARNTVETQHNLNLSATKMKQLYLDTLRRE